MTPEQNEHRLDLIEKQFDGGLSQAETVELEILQDMADKWRQEVAPLRFPPPFSELIKMKEYTVIWHYVANHGVARGYFGNSAGEILERVLAGFSEDFRKRGTVFIFEGQPVLEYKPS